MAKTFAKIPCTNVHQKEGSFQRCTEVLQENVMLCARKIAIVNMAPTSSLKCALSTGKILWLTQSLMQMPGGGGHGKQKRNEKRKTAYRKALRFDSASLRLCVWFSLIF